jgi:hypothetical protein
MQFFLGFYLSIRLFQKYVGYTSPPEVCRRMIAESAGADDRCGRSLLLLVIATIPIHDY